LNFISNGVIFLLADDVGSALVEQLVVSVKKKTEFQVSCSVVHGNECTLFMRFRIILQIYKLRGYIEYVCPKVGVSIILLG